MWQAILVLLAIIGGILAIKRKAAKKHEECLQMLEIHREWEACSFGVMTKEERDRMDSLGVESSHARPVVKDGEIYGFTKEVSRDG